MLEDKIKELESLVASLEKEGLDIEEGIKHFEKGLNLTKECLDSLAGTKGKITSLKKQMEELLEEPIGLE